MRKLTIILVLIFVAGTAYGKGFKNKTTVFGLKGGLITSGTVYVGNGVDFDFETDGSYSFGGFLDYKLAPKFLGGLTVDIHNISAFDESKTMLNLGATLKAMIYSETSNVMFRPGISLGYGSLGAIEAVGVESSQYFNVGGFVEVVYSMPGGLSWLGEAAIYAGPSGGNSDYTITFGPMFLIRGGVAF